MSMYTDGCISQTIHILEDDASEKKGGSTPALRTLSLITSNTSVPVSRMEVT